MKGVRIAASSTESVALWWLLAYPYPCADAMSEL